MRYREPFTVFPRKMKSGLVVWYYQTYDNNNRRTTARSTGQTLKGAARAYCNKLYKEDALIPNRGGNITFANYSVDWWEWDKCEYLRYRRSRRNLSKTYADSGKISVKNHLLPYFGKMRLEAITNYDIEKWLLTYAAKGLKNLTANVNLSFLKIMLGDAVRRGLLDINPGAKVSPLKKDTRQVPIPGELYEELELLSIKNGRKYLFSENGGDKPVCINNFNNSLKEAMTNIGIKKKEQVKRNLCFHGWRHFFNTTIRTNNISDSKVQKLTGHKTQAMTDHYTHFKADDFKDVQKIQAKILQMPRKVG